MQISLRQTEIEKAVVDYIAEQGITIANKEISVNFTAGRGENKLTAEIVIEPLGSVIPKLAVATVLEEPDMSHDEAKEPATPEKAVKVVSGLFS